MLEALGWIGDEQVVAYFRQEDMHVDLPESGWDLQEGKEPRRLWVNGCYQLQRTELGIGTTDTHPVNVGVQHEEHCGWCGRVLTTLFDLRLSTGRLAFLGLAGERLGIASCERCTEYSAAQKRSGLTCEPRPFAWPAPARNVLLPTCKSKEAALHMRSSTFRLSILPNFYRLGNSHLSHLITSTAS